MSRSVFKSWGSDLAPEEFAKALAAYGILEAGFQDLEWMKYNLQDLNFIMDQYMDKLSVNETTGSPYHYKNVMWLLNRMPGERLKDVGASLESLSILTELWTQLSAKWDIRLEILWTPEINEFTPWLITTLSLPDLRTRSVYVSYGDPAAFVNWSWPLNVGVLDNQDAQSFTDKLQERWWSNLSNIIILDEDEDVCDLLLLPFSLAEGLSKVRHSSPVKASLVIVLGGMSDNWQRSEAEKTELMIKIGAAGIAILDIKEKDQIQWYNYLIEEISHNQPLDIAIKIATQYFGEKEPYYFWTVPELLETSRLQDKVTDFIDRLESMPIDEKVQLNDRASHVLHLGEGEHFPDQIAQGLRDRMAHSTFDAESGDATDMADLFESTSSSVRSKELKIARNRWLQAQLSANERIIKKGFLPNTTYDLKVFIGPIPANEDTLIAPEAFPEDELPENKGNHQLTVVFSEPYHVPEPQIKTIILPSSGRSTSCLYHFSTASDKSDFEARIVVLYENRILQTVLLKAYVKADLGSLDEKDWISLELETAINPNLFGLEHKRKFNGAFFLNKNNDGLSRMLSVFGDDAKLISLEGIKEFKNNIESRLEEIADRPRSFPKDFKSKATTELMRYLAFQGNSLYRALVLDRIGKDHEIVKAKRIQIVSADHDVFFPMEFIYDAPLPSMDAEFCERAEDALKKGICQNCNEGKVAGSAAICPLGFWGLNKVIERHLSDRPVDSDELLRPSEHLIKKDALADRKILDSISSALFAASDKVDKSSDKNATLTQKEKVMNCLGTFVKGKVTEVDTWKGWVDGIANEKPSLLVLMPHTVQVNDIAAMEISADELLPAGAITEQYVAKKDSPPPVVLLMGCETDKGGIDDIPFQRLVAPFRQNGAAIVLSTRTKIRSRHSVPVFEKLITELSKPSKVISFGDVMLALRRDALVSGLPMVLCLFAYGDADWKIESKREN